jgi:hypothetical protein
MTDRVHQVRQFLLTGRDGLLDNISISREFWAVELLP